MKLDKSILGDEEWEYIQCHQADNFNDFKTQCSVCNKVDFKPRDIMKLIPDIDLFIVVEEINEEILEEVEKVSYDNEYTPSDIDIEKTLKETEETIDKNIEKNKFPMDIHLIDKEKFLSTLDEGIKGAYGQEIEMLAMYKGWKSIKLKILYSLVFSAEFLDDIKDNSLKGKIKEFYKNFFKKYDTFDKYVGFLKEGNVRVAKLLEDKHILKQFKKKFNRLNK